MGIFMMSYGMPMLVLWSMLLGGFIRMIFFYSFVCAWLALGMEATALEFWIPNPWRIKFQWLKISILKIDLHVSSDLGLT